MAQKMHAGRLNTKIRIQRQVTTGSGISKATTWVDLGSTSENDAARYVYACWEGLLGSESWIADSIQAERQAKATIRYRADVTESCRVVYRGANYEIVSLNILDQKHAWLEVRVKAEVNG